MWPQKRDDPQQDDCRQPAIAISRQIDGQRGQANADNKPGTQFPLRPLIRCSQYTEGEKQGSQITEDDGSVDSPSSAFLGKERIVNGLQTKHDSAKDDTSKQKTQSPIMTSNQ